jgi:hypothetical protein
MDNAAHSSKVVQTKKKNFFFKISACSCSFLACVEQQKKTKTIILSRKNFLCKE